MPFYRGVERKILPADVVPLVLRCVSTVKDYSSAGSVSRAWRSAARRLSAGGDSVSLVLDFVGTEDYFSAGSVRATRCDDIAARILNIADRHTWPYHSRYRRYGTRERNLLALPTLVMYLPLSNI